MHDRLNRNLIILGGGSIACGLIGLLSKDFKLAYKSVRLIADEITRDNLPSFVHTYAMKLHRSSISKQLRKFVTQGDVVVNLTVSVGTPELIMFCRDVGALYLDTANESWPSSHYPNEHDKRLSLLRNCKPDLPGSPTALICHGANPGLVTHFLKHALETVAKHTLSKSMYAHINGDDKWGQICKLVGIDRIDISEYDDQNSYDDTSIRHGGNTWSIPGLLDESFEQSCFAYSKRSFLLDDDNWQITSPSGQDKRLGLAISKNYAMENQTTTWIPSIGWFNGYRIPHVEQFSMASMCSWYEGSRFLHPTVQFVYSPCPAGKILLSKTFSDSNRTANTHVMIDEIQSGSDTLGITLFLNDGRIFWFGSSLSIETARSISKFNNATSLQVVAGVYSGLEYIQRYDRLGLVEPENIDHTMILDIAKPFLGNMIEAWGTLSSDSVNLNVKQKTTIDT